MINPRQLEDMIRETANKYNLFTGKGTRQENLNRSFLCLNQVIIDCEKQGEFRYGILEKSSGTNAFGYSADNIAFKDGSNHFDVIGDADAHDGPPRPSFGENGPIDSERVKSPLFDLRLDTQTPQPNPEPEPNPEPNPNPPYDIEAKLNKILENQDRIFRMVSDIEDRIDNWNNEGIPVDITGNFPDYVGRQSGWAGGSINLTPKK